jgi:hypothetical protein
MRTTCGTRLLLGILCAGLLASCTGSHVARDGTSQVGGSTQATLEMRAERMSEAIGGAVWRLEIGPTVTLIRAESVTLHDGGVMEVKASTCTPYGLFDFVQSAPESFDSANVTEDNCATLGPDPGWKPSGLRVHLAQVAPESIRHETYEILRDTGGRVVSHLVVFACDPGTDCAKGDFTEYNRGYAIPCKDAHTCETATEELAALVVAAIGKQTPNDNSGY